MKNIRILLLVYLLLFVAVGAWLARARTTDWDDTLYVGIYPINGDNSEVATRYIDALEASHFADIEEFVKREGLRYGVTFAEPARIELGTPVTEMPPQPPADRNIPGVMVWSLKLRYWAWQQQRQQPGPDPDIRIFLIYHDPALNPLLAHSLGLQKGLVGVVNAFASRRMAGSNNVVIAHELFHTLGATDKYYLNTNLPMHPHGYAEPLKKPLHPQKFAELMGGRIPLTAGLAETPESLRQVIVGPLTAAEVRWGN